MRYLILLVFVIPLASQSATVRGQTCTVTDLENADPGCCASTMYMCSDLTVSGQSSSNKISCCNANTQCKWVTGKYPTLSNQNTCQPNNDIRCTAQTIDNCKITEGANHGDILSSTGNKTRCADNYTGSCSYECYGGTWHEADNQCKEKCSSETKNNCSLTASNHNQTSGSCASSYPNGSCSYTCKDGTWATPSTNNCSATPVRCDATTKSNCVLPEATNGGAGSCEIGYRMSCRYICTNGNWVEAYNMCRKNNNYCRNVSPSTPHCGGGSLGSRGIGDTIKRDCTANYQAGGKCTFRCNANKKFSVLSHTCVKKPHCPATNFYYTYNGFQYRCPLPEVLSNGTAYCDYGDRNAERGIKGFVCSSNTWVSMTLVNRRNARFLCDSNTNCYQWRYPGGWASAGGVREPNGTLAPSSRARHSRVKINSGALRSTKFHYQ